MQKVQLLLKLALACTIAGTIAGSLAGCGARDEAQPTTTPAATATPAPTDPAKPVSAEELKELKETAAATQESAGEDVDPGDASLERLAALPESAQLPGGRWKAGTHYQPIVPAQSTSAEPGEVEILEVFWLGCPHCYSLEPYIQRWKKSKPAYVKFVGEHVMWGPAHRSHARFYYTLQALGKADELVPKAFEEIHHNGNMLVAADDAQSQRLQLAFAKANGISEADFKREYNGFAVNTRLQRAEEVMRRYKVESVPYFVINGKYHTDVSMAGGEEQLIQLFNDMAATEKSR